VSVDGADQVVQNWDAIKRDEKHRTSIFDGIPMSQPSLGYADAVQRKAAKVGFDWPDVHGAVPKIAEETAELMEALAAGDRSATEDELGDLLFAVVNVARHAGVEPETALRVAAQKFRRRFEAVERLALERGIDLRATAGQDDGLAALDALWDQVKSDE
jgi:tetrapyrrole methylase family protein / MazG family protein